MSRRADGTLTFVVGCSGAGKTAYVRAAIARHARVVIWDAKGEFAELGLGVRVTSLEGLYATLRAGTVRAAYVPRFAGARHREFDAWAGLALAYTQLAPATIVAEEFASQTNAVRATGEWARIVNQGRGFGARTFAIMQRAQEVDKSTLGNAQRIVCLRLQTQRDRDYMAAEVGIEAPTDALEYVELDQRTGRMSRGAIRWRDGVPRLVARA